MEADALINEPIRITAASELEKLTAHIHDEYFELDGMSFSAEEDILEIPYRRIFHGGPRTVLKKSWVSTTYEVDVVRSVLIIHNVKRYEFEDRAGIGTYSFNKISYGGNTLRIVTCEGPKLEAIVEGLYIESRDIEVRGKARVTCGLWGESYSSKVYE